MVYCCCFCFGFLFSLLMPFVAYASHILYTVMPILFVLSCALYCTAVSLPNSANHIRMCLFFGMWFQMYLYHIYSILTFAHINVPFSISAIRYSCFHSSIIHGPLCMLLGSKHTHFSAMIVCNVLCRFHMCCMTFSNIRACAVSVYVFKRTIYPSVHAYVSMYLCMCAIHFWDCIGSTHLFGMLYIYIHYICKPTLTDRQDQFQVIFWFWYCALRSVASTAQRCFLSLSHLLSTCLLLFRFIPGRHNPNPFAHYAYNGYAFFFALSNIAFGIRFSFFIFLFSNQNTIWN